MYNSLRKIPVEEIRDWISKSNSLSDLLRHLGIPVGGKARIALREVCEREGISLVELENRGKDLSKSAILYAAGESNPNWKGGHKYWAEGRWGTDKNGLSWKVQRALCRERDNHTCQDCGKTKEEIGREPDCDHIVPYRISGSHALDNLKLRCPACHHRVEANRTELWDGHIFSKRPRKPGKKRSCEICAKRRKLNEENHCLVCQREYFEIPLAQKLKSEGKTYREIAAIIGKDRMAVWKWLNGVPRPSVLGGQLKGIARVMRERASSVLASGEDACSQVSLESLVSENVAPTQKSGIIVRIN